MRPDRLAWFLIAAVALAASACGHALELTLENLQLFGDGRAAYAHPAQLFELEMAGTLFLIAAVAIGGTSFEKGNGWLFGTVLGVLLVGVLRNGLNLLAVPSSLQVAAIGLLIIAALVIESFKGK